MTEFSSAAPFHRSGKLRFVAIASARRSELASDVPTMIESGVKDFVAGSYIGILAPTGVPADVLARLQSAVPTLEPALQRLQSAAPTREAVTRVLLIHRTQLRPTQTRLRLGPTSARPRRREPFQPLSLRRLQRFKRCAS
jgi:hypothetical protein